MQTGRNNVPRIITTFAQEAYSIMSLNICKIFNDTFPLRTVKAKKEQYKQLDHTRNCKIYKGGKQTIP